MSPLGEHFPSELLRPRIEAALKPGCVINPNNSLAGLPASGRAAAARKILLIHGQMVMFLFAADEKTELATRCDHLANLKYSPALPYAYTEHGTFMAANVSNSPRVIGIGVHVVRATKTVA